MEEDFLNVIEVKVETILIIFSLVLVTTPPVVKMWW
jgi:hypothetical protein